MSSNTTIPTPNQATAKSPRKPVTVQDILLYIPNLIGYFRIITAIISFLCMKNHPVLTSIFYGISGFLDAFDGYAARKYNQGTRFGAVLDMVTDRCATSSLIVYIGVLYPHLDLASHYMHMYAMLSAGSTSHKNVDETQSKLLSLYYTNRNVLFVVCLVNELFYMAIYLHHYGYFWMGTVMCIISAPIWLFKQVANVIQLKNASLILARMDAEEHSKRD
ncbi:CDP-diacylglycerol--inositol 3-phosphatidyltransferase [Candida viswanathii]|uniref:CDP-diacylglycerol--inositol 3-phosphatidyltransferase n=1 Tax=Candida viswanathii TaxID=5486 RepID=A0A367XPN8_9ASCO|nr:CDP-diacylglycerol--inositol 3-phosphatidyltransferase [Candida viswanathii]